MFKKVNSVEIKAGLEGEVEWLGPYPGGRGEPGMVGFDCQG